jgi:methylated-DNA-[protein]-cysteine S-methyltransferase
MAMREGACHFDLWWVHVSWDAKDVVHRIRFLSYGAEGTVPGMIRDFLSGEKVDLSSIPTVATERDAPFSPIYRAVQEIPYGLTATYGEIAGKTGTSPRTVGVAMRRNPTPLIVPCHRVVSVRGVGGFTPDIRIKMALLAMEQGKK